MRVSKWNQDSLRSDGQLIDRRSLKVALNRDCHLKYLVDWVLTALLYNGEPEKMPLQDMDREQMWLLPPTLDELLPSDHHDFQVRCVEADGTPQIEEDGPPRPDGAMPVDVREDAVGAIERLIWWADAPPLSADDPPPGVEPAAAVHMPTPTPTPTPSYTPTVLRVGAQRPVMPSPTATSAPTPVRDGLIPLHELRTGLCVDLGKGFMPGQFKNAQRQGPTEAQVVSCDESTRHYRVASIAAAGAYCPRDTRSTITLVDDRAVYCLVHEWKITPTPTLLPGVTPPPTRTLGPTVTPRPTRTPGYPGGIPLTPDGIETWVLHYTNEERATVVLAPFVHDQAISKIAGRHSAMMSRHGYSHTVLGRGPTDRALASGYNCRAYRADGSYTYGLSENIHQLHRVTSWENRGTGWRPLGFTFATD